MAAPADAKQQPLNFGAGAAAPAEREPELDRSTKAAKGMLTHGRQKEIARDPNSIMKLVQNWDNRTLVPQATIAKMKYSQRDMITANMKPITDVLSKEKHLSTVKGQFRGYFETASSHPVECFEKKGTEIEKLLKDTIGDMNPKDFKQTINDSALGRLNKYLGMLRTFVSEEMDERVRCVLRVGPSQSGVCAQLMRSSALSPRFALYPQWRRLHS
jgi:hypothetical protein